MQRFPWLAGMLLLWLSVASFATAQEEDRFAVMRARALGRDLYTAHCASCHGSSGHGDGPNTTELRAKASNLTRLAERNNWIFPAVAVRRVIAGADPIHRDREMPLWGNVFSASEGPGTPDAATKIDALAHYLEFVQYRPRNQPPPWP
jgi:mono/diheme cytochrome c family protein